MKQEGKPMMRRGSLGVLAVALCLGKIAVKAFSIIAAPFKFIHDFIDFSF